MIALTNDQIKEIAEQLEVGFKCFWNKENGELLFVPDTDAHPEMDNEVFEENSEKLNNNFFDYKEIERMESKDSFEIMEEFTELVDDIELKNKLTNALSRRKPFREFKFVIDNSGIYRQQWFDFKKRETKGMGIGKNRGDTTGYGRKKQPITLLLNEIFKKGVLIAVESDVLSIYIVGRGKRTAYLNGEAESRLG